MEKKLKNLKKIVLTGGHAASSALVVAEEIKRQNKPWDIYWIGFKSSVEGENISTLSSIYFPKYGIKTFTLVTGRVQRNWTVHTIPSILKIPVGFIHAFMLLGKIKPGLILSFGGFSAFPVVVMGYLLGIPVIIHEQTSVVGRANKFSSYFARKIAISRETSLKYFPSDKCVLTGNPIPKDIKVKTGLVSFPTVPILLITGGQSGSVPINNAVEKILTTLLKKYKVIHLTGLKEEKKFIKIKSGLRDQLRKRYLVYGIIDPKEYNRYFNESSILISRSGANTVTKIVATRKPSVLIPLPISYLQEQEINAIFASRISGARVLNQYNLNHSDILKELDYLKNNWKEIYKGLEKQKNPDLSASENIVALMEKNLK